MYKFSETTYILQASVLFVRRLEAYLRAVNARH